MKVNHRQLANNDYDGIHHPSVGTEQVTDNRLVNEHASDSWGNSNEYKEIKSMVSPFIYPPDRVIGKHSLVVTGFVVFP